MSENNLIYEITQQLSSKKTVQSDINEAIGLVTNYFKNKYIDKIEAVVNENYNKIQKNPTKEIQLLNAIKPFLKETQHEQFNKFISSFTAVTAIQNIRSDIKNHDVVSIQSVNLQEKTKKDPSIKSDGIYDIDESCIKRKKVQHNNPFSHDMTMILFLLLILNVF